MASKGKFEDKPTLSKDRKRGQVEENREKPSAAKKPRVDQEKSLQAANAENAKLSIQLENERKAKEEALARLQSVNAKNDQLCKQLENERKIKENALIRLSSMASNMLRDNNPNIADLSDPNRPTKLSEQFSELYDNEWTDAFDELQKIFGDKEDKEVISYLLRLLLDENKVPPELFKTIKDAIKSTAPKYIKDVQVHVQSHLKKWLPFKSLEDCLEAVNVKRYIDKCTEVCWYMSVQDPQLFMEGDQSPEGKLDSSKYREYTKKGPYEEFVVWPVLYLYRGGPMLSKGVAQGSKLKDKISGKD
ncbi:hypothetical protein CHS0354_018697 [Potamilus streckersoni]|uniref:Mitochondria-eating protein n=1 Tax=Potamilus streckersoni TaxID=2493646 RepID=A0AAE0SKG1_9BIVA|nr:hypothetical protein CHS0354_018697 [Potamilus streckersoni]